MSLEIKKGLIYWLDKGRTNSLVKVTDPKLLDSTCEVEYIIKNHSTNHNEVAKGRLTLATALELSKVSIETPEIKEVLKLNTFENNMKKPLTMNEAIELQIEEVRLKQRLLEVERLLNREIVN